MLAKAVLSGSWGCSMADWKDAWKDENWAVCWVDGKVGWSVDEMVAWRAVWSADHWAAS